MTVMLCVRAITYLCGDDDTVTWQMAYIYIYEKSIIMYENNRSKNRIYSKRIFFPQNKKLNKDTNDFIEKKLLSE